MTDLKKEISFLWPEWESEVFLAHWCLGDEVNNLNNDQFKEFAQRIKKENFEKALLFLSTQSNTNINLLFSRNRYLFCYSVVDERSTEVLHENGRVAWMQCDLKRLEDPFIAKENIQLFKITNAQLPKNGDADLTSCLFFLWGRLGLALSLFDKVIEHNAERVSGGVKTLQHESVIHELSESLIRISSVLDNLETMGDCGVEAYLHQEITEGTAGLLKMIGGHGYLENSFSRLGYLSMIMGHIVEGGASC